MVGVTSDMPMSTEGSGNDTNDRLSDLGSRGKRR